MLLNSTALSFGHSRARGATISAKLVNVLTHYPPPARARSVTGACDA
jgi:hypothetical protein